MALPRIGGVPAGRGDRVAALPAMGQQACLDGRDGTHREVRVTGARAGRRRQARLHSNGRGEASSLRRVAWPADSPPIRGPQLSAHDRTATRRRCHATAAAGPRRARATDASRPAPSRRPRPEGSARRGWLSARRAVPRPDRDRLRERPGRRRVQAPQGGDRAGMLATRLDACLRRRDSHPANAGGRKRSGLAYVLEQLANGDASRVATGRLDHLARSPRRLGALLEWCARHGVDPIAVDVGLDTKHARWAPCGGPSPRRGVERGRARCAAHGTEAPTSGQSQRIPRQTGRTDRGPMAPQAPVALIGWTR
jgi:Resolvase, N terminal domain